MRTLALAAISAALLADIAATRIMSVQRCGLSIVAHRLEHPLTATGTVFWSPFIVEFLALAAAVISSGARSCTIWRVVTAFVPESQDSAHGRDLGSPYSGSYILGYVFSEQAIGLSGLRLKRVSA